MNILVTICARGGSKGIPGKNVKMIAGRPLIAYTIELAKKVKLKFNAKVSLSTDDEQILKVAESYDVFTAYLRPEYLATDSAGKKDTIKDLVIYEESLINGKYDFVLDLDVTSPLRTLSDVEKAFDLIVNKPDALTLFSVNSASRNPYFNMVEENEYGFYSLVKTNSDGSVMTRQSAPNVYELNASFYWYRRSYFDSEHKNAITDKSLIYLMDHICFDLDHPIDFLFMEYLLNNEKLDFEI